MAQEIISKIINTGTVVMTTVLSFVVSPPVVSAEDDSPIKFSNIAVFLAGVLCIYLFDKFKGKVLKKFILIMALSIFVLFLSYQWMYNKYSINCWSNTRVIISTAPVKPAVREQQEYWKKYPNPIQKLSEAYRCNSTEIWEMGDLAFPYYGLLVLYVSIIISFILIVIAVSDIIVNTGPSPS